MVPDTLERVPEMQDTPPCPHSKQHSGATLEFSAAESLNMSRKNKVALPMRWRNKHLRMVKLTIVQQSRRFISV